MLSCASTRAGQNISVNLCCFSLSRKLNFDKNSLLARCICFPRNFPQPIFSQLNAVAAFCKRTGVFLLCQLTRDKMHGHARTQAARDYSPLSKPAPNSLRQPVFHSARVPELLWRDLREAICWSQRSKVRAAAFPRASPAPCCRKAAGTLQEPCRKAGIVALGAVPSNHMVYPQAGGCLARGLCWCGGGSTGLAAVRPRTDASCQPAHRDLLLICSVPCFCVF